MINFDEYTNDNKKEHNFNWPYIPDHPIQNINNRGIRNRQNKCIIIFDK